MLDVKLALARQMSHFIPKTIIAFPSSEQFIWILLLIKNEL